MTFSGKTPLVFISYSRKDTAFSQRLSSNLNDAGIQIWMDTQEIIPGKVGSNIWDTAIQTAIKDCDYFVPIISSSSMKSENVLDECNYAINLDKPIVPVLQEDYELYYRLQRLQWVDFTENYEFGLRELTNTLQGNPTSEMQVASPSQYLSDEEFYSLLFRNKLCFFGGLMTAALLTLIITIGTLDVSSIILSILATVIVSTAIFYVVEYSKSLDGKKLTQQQLVRLRGFRKLLIPQSLFSNSG